ncbi:MAG: Maf family nucleotide pyrophosphatase [Rikenellaceae bacterium]
MTLNQKLENYNIILGSKSPRRKQLLADLGIDFKISDDYFCDESYPSELEQTKVPEYIAEQKAKAYPFDLKDNDILITADTVVILEGKILGKPKDKAEAIEMLSMLSGKAHCVVTGVVLSAKESRHSFSVSTMVKFRELRIEEIEYYVDTFKPYDKAGSYGIQEWIGYIGIESIDGSFFNVMGLPTQRLYSALENFICE